MNEEFATVVRDQIGVETRIVEVANRSVSKILNKLLRELIRGIALDSEKHRMVLKALLAAEESLATPLIDEKSSDEIRKGIEEHIDLEARAIEAYQKALRFADDSKIKFILEYIIGEERRHHALLLLVHKMLVEPQTYHESDLWDMVWQFSVSHGSPGG